MRQVCRNPRCGDAVSGDGLLHLCPSCRLAGQSGAAAAFVVFLIGHVVAQTDWLTMMKSVLGPIFNR